MKACSLDEYFQLYGQILGQNASRSLDPIHTPGADRPEQVKLKHPLFEPQAHVATAAAKALRRQKSIIIVGEMGTGKTRIGAATVVIHARGRPYRALVFCPGQLVKKWERELRSILADVRVTQIATWSDVLRLPAAAPAGHEWFIISRDRAKLGAKWAPAVVRRKRLEMFARCPHCFAPAANDKGIHWSMKELEKTKRACARCGGPLWSFTSQLRRWEPARYIHKHLPGYFNYLILDEVHEEKSADSAQANAAGALVASCGKVVALTGTLVGGYAEHIRPLLFRLAPETVVAKGFEWKQPTRFSEVYGRIETTVVERQSEEAVCNRQSNSRATKRTTKVTRKVIRPGIMPSLFGRHLIGNTLFISLCDVLDDLPPLSEHPIGVALDGLLEGEYMYIEEKLTEAIRKMLRSGNRALLGSFIHTLLAYPDHPFGWEQVGYWDKTPSGEKMFVPVAMPQNLCARTVYPKEAQLLEIVRGELRDLRKCWVYVQYTQKHDVCTRLQKLLREAGIKSEILRASVPLAKREEWIAEHGTKNQVIISHPALVQTGLDFFGKHGEYNFPTLIFYEQGYQPFTLRQAAARAWRIGQQLPCKVFYLYYEGTMQARAMALMGKKIVAAQSLEGKFSSEGLAAMAGDGESDAMALARSLAEQIDEGDVASCWKRVSGQNCEINDDEVASLASELGRLDPTLGNYPCLARR